MKKSLLLCCALFLLCTAYAQTWEPLGPPLLNQPSPDSVQFSDMALDTSGQMYVVMSDNYHGGKLSVRRYNGTEWTDVGTPGFTPGQVSYTNIAFDGNNIPYVSYRDDVNDGKITVVRYVGGNWLTVGSGGFSDGHTGYCRIAIAPDNTPYVAYSDWENGQKVTVKKFDGTNWVTVGTQGFTAGSSFGLDIAIDGTGTPYIVFVTGAQGLKASVMKYDGSAWAYVGTAGFSAGVAEFTCLAIDKNNVPYVFYQDDGNSRRGTCMKYDGSAWVPVGNPGFTTTSGEWDNDITIDTAGNIWVVYTAVDVPAAFARVVKYNGTTWEDRGNGMFGYRNAGPLYNAIAVARNGTVYLASIDYTKGRRIAAWNCTNTTWQRVGTTNFSTTGAFEIFRGLAVGKSISYAVLYGHAENVNYIMKYNGSNWEYVGAPDEIAIGGNNAYVAADENDVPYLAYIDKMNGNKPTVKKYTGGAWVPVGATLPVLGPIAIGDNGTPYVFYTSGQALNLLKYNGSNWVNVGPANFATYINVGPSFAVSPVDATAYATMDGGYCGSCSPLQLMKYNGSTWENIPVPAEYSGDLASVHIDNAGTVYIRHGSFYGQYVHRLNGTTWENVGNTSFATSFEDLCFDSSGNIYTQSYYADQAVFKYDGAAWGNVGNTNFMEFGSYLASTSSGILYAAGRDNWGYRYIQQPNNPSIHQPSISQSGLCYGTAYTVSFTTSGTFNPGNIFTVELSDVNGSFTNPTQLGSLSSTTGGTIVDTIDFFADGYSYRLRIASSDPPMQSLENNQRFSITSEFLSAYAGADTNYQVCNPNSYIDLSEQATFTGNNCCYRQEWFPQDIVYPGGNMINPLSPGTYTVWAQATSWGGCVAIDSVVVTIGYGPMKAEIRAESGPAEWCEGSTGFTVLAADILNYGGNVTYKWSDGNIFSANQVWQGNKPTGNTEYRLTVTNQEGCIALDTFTLTQHPAPLADAGMDKSICPGDSVQIGGSPTGNGGTAPYNYSWSAGAAPVANPVVKPLSTTPYLLSLSDVNNCTATDTVTVSVGSGPQPQVSIAANQPDTICRGTNITYTATPVNGGATPNYTWLLNGNVVQNGPSDTYRFLTTPTRLSNLQKNHTVKCVITANTGCATGTDTSNTQNITILEKPLRTAITGKTRGVCGNAIETYNCFASPGATYYTWTCDSGQILSGQGTTSVSIQFKADFTIGHVTVVAGNSCGISNTATSLVKCSLFKTGEETGIEEEDVNTLVNIYPNPTVGSWQLAVSNEYIGSSIEVYDVNGKLIFNSKLETQNTELSLSVSTGVYLLRIVNNKGSVVKRLVKM